MKRTIVSIVAIAFAAAVPVLAHHSFSAFYFEDQRVTIKGDLVEFQYRNPHAWVHIMVTEPDGLLQRYSAEWGGTGRLRRQGIEADTLQPGDHLIITGAPGRNPDEHRLHLKEVQRPADGWTYASRGRGRDRNRR